MKNNDYNGPEDAGARNTDPETSHEAADHLNEKGGASRIEGIALHALEAIGGRGTAYQIETKVKQDHDLDSNTISPRLKPLERKGLIRRTDQRGPGRGSRRQIVWEVAQ